MNEEDKVKDEGESESAALPKPDYSKDDNVQARLRAGKRSSNKNAGKTDLYEGVKDNMLEPEAVAPEKEPEGFAEGGEVKAEGGIVAEAQKELDAVQADKEDGGEAAEEAAEGGTGAPEEEKAEGEEPTTAVEEFAKEEMTEPEHKDSGAVEQFAKEEASEPQHQKKMQPVGEYVPPEGVSHDELIDKYHEAVAFGDLEQAKQLYKQMQEHRFQENKHRGKSEAQAEQEAQAFLDATDAIVAKHPELGEDGLEANKVLALSDVYRQEGLSAVEAIQKAVADLYPEGAAMQVPEMPPEMPSEEPAAEEPMAEEAPAEEPAAEEAPAEEPVVPPMEDRMANKRKIVTLPSANARKEEAPAPKQATRSDAIMQMKAKRGQL
jgi:hypothetical protein